VTVPEREIPPQIRALFEDDEIAEIGAHPIVLGENTERDAIDMAMAWSAHVRKIDADRALPWEDRSVWTEHDLAAALYIRDFVQLALDKLSVSLRDRLQQYVTTVDDHFRSYTVDDPAGRMGKVAHVDLAGRGWWWRRVPDSGPIVDDLRRY
jgi:hypothetical protein